MSKFESRKQAIVRAAVEVINRKGVRGMTLGDVAAQLGLVPSAVGYYFRKKEELAAVCLMASIERFESIVNAAEAGASARERIDIYLSELLTFWRDMLRGEAEPIVLFNEVRTIGDPAVDAAYMHMYRRVRALLDVEPGQRLDRLERNARAHLFLTQMIWVTLWIYHYDSKDFEKIRVRIVDILAGGLAAPGHQWSAGWMPAAAPAADLPGDLAPPAFLKAATELINQQGYRGASVAKIASRLNLTKGAFYHHHDAKEDLIEACFARTLEVIRSVQDEAEARGVNGLERLCLVTGTLFRHQLSGEIPLLRISALAAVSEKIAEHIFRSFSRVSLHFAGIVAEGVADGSVRPVDSTVAGFMITAMISGATELGEWAPGVTPETAAEAFARPLIEGLFCPAGNI